MAYTEVDRPKLVLPFVEPIYEGLKPYSDLLVRVSLGAILMPHGFEKLFLDAAARTARNPLLSIFGDPLVGAYFIGCVEFFGGLMLVLGLFTRFAAAAIVIQMGVISFLVLWPNWFWGNRGMEFALFMGLIALAIFIRGGGPYSLDRKIGREL
jgi:putative oxidoreductase